MSSIKGMGSCAIPKEDGRPCSRQIVEGEPIGSITQGSVYNPASTVGHKHCADAWYARKAQKEREKNTAMVQRINQQGPGGAVNPNEAFDAVGGSTPLVKPTEETPAPPPLPLPSSSPPQGQIVGDISGEGVVYVGDIPFEEEAPEEAPVEPPKPAHFVQAPAAPQRVPVRGESAPAEHLHPQLGELSQQAPPSEEVMRMLPSVGAHEGDVVLGTAGPVAKFDPDDADDLIEMIKINAKRARRQRLAQAHAQEDQSK